MVSVLNDSRSKLVQEYPSIQLDGWAGEAFKDGDVNVGPGTDVKSEMPLKADI